MLKKKKKGTFREEKGLLQIIMLAKIKILIERLRDKVGEIWKLHKKIKERKDLNVRGPFHKV